MKTKQNEFRRIFARALTGMAVMCAVSPPSTLAASVTVTPAVSLPEWSPYIVSLPSSDPRAYSWMINKSGNLARVRLTYGAAAVSTWSAIDTSWPAYDPAGPTIGWKEQWEKLTGLTSPPEVSDVLANITVIQYSNDYIYITSSGLPSYTMGPWYNDADGDGIFTAFEFRPLDRTTVYENASDYTYKAVLPIFKIPRNPPDLKYKDKWPTPVCRTELGAIGVWVNGTAVYAPWDGFTYASDGTIIPGVPEGIGSWNGNAYWSESITFDPAEFHQDGPGTNAVPVETWGQYHSHINPIGLRAQLGDHIKVISRENEITYEELPATTGHSPILGWAKDGYPIYGPYAYVNPCGPVLDSTAVRAMRSGYVLRDGRYGTDNLRLIKRTKLPGWADACGRPDGDGPSPGKWVLTTLGGVKGLRFVDDPVFPLGSLAEDYDYRGDLPGGGTLYTDWDLDRFNGRWCKTPDFPEGTYAYFISLDDELNPQFPYIVGPAFRGNPSGGDVESVPGLHIINWLYSK